MKNCIFLILILFAAISCQNKPLAVTEESFDDGTPKLIRYYKQSGDTIPVKEEYYYDNGQKRMEGSYQNGQRHGKWTYWYANGNIWSTGDYYEGIENGTKTVYHENGQLYYEGKLQEGKRKGVWKFYDKNGKLLKEVDYEKQNP